jgi:hypothetical protein
MITYHVRTLRASAKNITFLKKLVVTGTRLRFVRPGNRGLIPGTGVSSTHQHDVLTGTAVHTDYYSVGSSIVYRSIKGTACVNSGFHCGVNQICALLGLYEAWSGFSYERFGTTHRSHLQGSKLLSPFRLLHTVLAADHCHQHFDGFRSARRAAKLSKG